MTLSAHKGSSNSVLEEYKCDTFKGVGGLKEKDHGRTGISGP